MIAAALPLARPIGVRCRGETGYQTFALRPALNSEPWLVRGVGRLGRFGQDLAGTRRTHRVYVRDAAQTCSGTAGRPKAPLKSDPDAGSAPGRRQLTSALLHCAIPVHGQGMITRMPRWSDGDGEVVEGIP